MLKILNGRDYFYQWDLNQRLIVDDPNICEVNFCNGTLDCTLACGIYKENGLLLVDVPNCLLQSALPIMVFTMVKNSDQTYTSRKQRFLVVRRTKPEDYVYTETECLRKSLEERVAIIEENYLRDDELEAAIKEALRIAQNSGLVIGGTGASAVSAMVADKWYISTPENCYESLIGAATHAASFQTEIARYDDDTWLPNDSNSVASTHAVKCNGIEFLYIQGLVGKELAIMYHVESTDETLQEIIAPDNRVLVYFMGQWNCEAAKTVDFGYAQNVSVSFKEILEVIATKKGGTLESIDFTNFENGSFTEVVDGEEVTHTVTFDDSGNPISIDGVTITWG